MPYVNKATRTLIACFRYFEGQYHNKIFILGSHVIFQVKPHLIVHEPY